MGIKLKRSSVAAKAPVVGDLELGELAVNTYDGTLYLKKNDGTETIVEVTGSDDTRHGTRAGGTLHAAATTSVAGFQSSADKTKLDGVSTGADATGAAIHAATAKTTPVDADTIGLIDSAASNALKKLSWANLKATLKTYFDTLYVALSGSALTGGFTATAVDDGTKSSGTYTPSPADGNFRRAVNGGAHNFAAPTASGDYTLIVQYTNNASAGAITLTGFSKTSGDAFTTVNGDDFLVFITRVNGFSHAQVVALQ
jgi:hypothetical protein